MPSEFSRNNSFCECAGCRKAASGRRLEFGAESIGQYDITKTVLDIFFVEDSHFLNLILYLSDERMRPRNPAVFVSFPAADDNDAVAKIDIVDAETESFEETKSGTIEKRGNEIWDPVHFSQNCESFIMSKDVG